MSEQPSWMRKGYSPDLHTPENAGIIKNGVVVDIQNEDRFSPQNGFAFNPLAPDGLMSVENLILLFIVKKFSETPEGRVQLASIIKNYLDSTTKILTSIVETGKAHPVTALNASTLFSVVAHRMGLISDAGYLKMADQTRSLADKMILMAAAGIAFDGVSSLVEAGGKVAAATAGGK